MAMSAQPPTEPWESLDPQDWNALQALGHQMLDDMFDHLRTSRDRPVWKPMPAEVRKSFRAALPRQGQPAEAVYQAFRETILPYNMGNDHPRFWGWVMGNGTPLGMLADMLASGLNPNLGGADHAAVEVELQVIEWCKAMFDWPESASGLLVSGGSVANLIGLAVARNARAGFDVRRDGLMSGRPQLTFYASAEQHSSVERAVEVLGIGAAALRKIPVDDAYRIDIAALEAQIQADQEMGMHPIGLIGCAGTTNTGAVDPLDALADVAEKYNLWFHIDGAFGALAYLAPSGKERLKGLDRADSLAFDLHKWFYLPFEIGCTLMKDAEAHRRTFAAHPDYLEKATRGLASGEVWFGDYGIQLTRSFRALKAWMGFRTYGVDRVGRVIDQNLRQADDLGRQIEASESLERLAPTDLNVVCFRFIDDAIQPTDLDAFNEELLIRLQESGAAVPSSTMLKGNFALRCAITNHRSRHEDFDLLLDAVNSIGREMLEAGWKPSADEADA
jgi:aromatic-L-amino-acid decarboxylase